MANDKKGSPHPGSGAPLALHCLVDKCKGKIDRMSFCTEHYAWFKEGLISKKGERPPDFDKKYQAYLHRTKKAA